MNEIPALLMTFSIFQIAHFENQRWAKARANGLRGESTLFGLVVDGTHVAASAVKYILVGYSFYAVGWTVGAMLLAVLFLVPMIYGFICLKFNISDNITLWVTGTLATWIAGFFCIYLLTNLAA